MADDVTSGAIGVTGDAAGIGGGAIFGAGLLRAVLLRDGAFMARFAAGAFVAFFTAFFTAFFVAFFPRVAFAAFFATFFAAFFVPPRAAFAVARLMPFRAVRFAAFFVAFFLERPPDFLAMRTPLCEHST